MDAKDLKAIGNLLDKKLGEKLDEKLQPINDKLDAHSGSLMTLEKEIGIYKDGLDIERKRINEHETRLAKVEETLAV